MPKSGSNHRVNIGKSGSRLGGTVKVRPGDPAYHEMNMDGLKRQEVIASRFLEAKARQVKTWRTVAVVSRLHLTVELDRKVHHILRTQLADINRGLDCVFIVCDGECCKKCAKEPMYVAGRNIHAIANKRGLCKGIQVKVAAALALPRK